MKNFMRMTLLIIKNTSRKKQTLEEKRYDAVAQKNADEYSTWQKDADAWQELRNTYDDWDKYGDSEEDFLKRKIDRVKEFLQCG